MIFPLTFSRKIYTTFLIVLIVTSSSPIKCQVPNTDNPHSILLLIDVSGSMVGAKIDSVKSAAKQIIKMLLPCNTEFAIMGFSGKKDNPVPFQMDFSKNEFDLLTFVDKLKPEGGTLLGMALKKACFDFSNHKTNKQAKRSVILLSDGRSDDNIPAALSELRDRNTLIQCECIGFDIENDKIAEGQLKQIAHETGGEYYVATDVTNIIKAFLKTSIKTIIHEIPVVVQKNNKNLNFPLLPDNFYKLLTTQNWILDSIQINVSNELYEITQQIADENMQDTLPKSLIFDNSKKVSLFINKGSDSDANKKWIEGNFTFAFNSLSITIQHYYFKLILKTINDHAMVLCVNKFKNFRDYVGEENEQICDCGNKVNATNPYIFIYFSKAGCNQ
jgi:uncharacterized protein YegL